MLQRLWIKLIIICIMSCMGIKLSVSSDFGSNDPLSQNDNLVDQPVVTPDAENTGLQVSATRYGMGYELRMEQAQQRADIERVNKAEKAQRPVRPERPERFNRPDRPQRPERPNRPGR